MLYNYSVKKLYVVLGIFFLFGSICSVSYASEISVSCYGTAYTAPDYSPLGCNLQSSDAGGEWRDFLVIDLTGYDVSSSTLFANVDKSNSGHVDIYEVTKSFTSAVTWNKYNGTDSWDTLGGDFADLLGSYTLLNNNIDQKIELVSNSINYIALKVNGDVTGLSGASISNLKLIFEATQATTSVATSTNFNDIVYMDGWIIFLLALIFMGLIFNSLNPKK